MVDGQLRPNKVRDRRILEAMRSLKREAFVPARLAAQAYIDEAIPLGRGRVLLKPLVIARLLQLAQPRAGEAALVVGSGSGYGAAILASCGVQVTALEEDAELLQLARQAPLDTSLITLVQGRLADGYAATAPYDLVVIEGAVREIPDTIGRQVSANGRLVAIVAVHGQTEAGGNGVAVLAEPSVGGLRARPVFDAAAPLLPGLLAAPGFQF
jgi:protein-L-isoaspartate(D-aspartate) O-methyltransferase